MNVLFIAENQRHFIQLAQRLERNGCRWQFASTTEEVRSQIYQIPPELVLSTRPVTHGSALMEVLSGFACNVFYSYSIDGSCLWMQAIRDGQACLKPAVLRGAEFTSAIRQMLGREGGAAASPRRLSLKKELVSRET